MIDLTPAVWIQGWDVCTIYSTDDSIRITDALTLAFPELAGGGYDDIRAVLKSFTEAVFNMLTDPGLTEDDKPSAMTYSRIRERSGSYGIIHDSYIFRLAVVSPDITDELTSPDPEKTDYSGLTSDWFDGWTIDGDDIVIENAFGPSGTFPELTADEARGATGDIRKVMFAIWNKVIKTWAGLNEDSLPSHLRIESYGSESLLRVETSFEADPDTDTLTFVDDHGLSADDEVNIYGPRLPGGLAEGTYYVKTAPTSDTMTLTASPGGATIDITSYGEGAATDEDGEIIARVYVSYEPIENEMSHLYMLHIDTYWVSGEIVPE